MELETVQWQVPTFEARTARVWDGLKSRFRKAKAFSKANPATETSLPNMRVFDGIFRDKSRSTLITNELKYDIRKFCETLAEVREIAGYGSDIPLTSNSPRC